MQRRYVRNHLLGVMTEKTHRAYLTGLHPPPKGAHDGTLGLLLLVENDDISFLVSCEPHSGHWHRDSSPIFINSENLDSHVSHLNS